MPESSASPASERAGLLEFLTYKRDALIEALDGLSDAQARATPTVSSLSLLGLAKHSAIWEYRWFQIVVAGSTTDFDGTAAHLGSDGDTFQLAETDTVESVVAEYRRQITMSNQVLSQLDLDAPCALPAFAGRNLRWVALHMIEETAQHVGHADIIRESIDGTRRS